MADLVITEKQNLVNIADAIREKAELEESFVFPTGFVEAIAGISAGGGIDITGTLGLTWSMQGSFIQAADSSSHIFREGFANKFPKIAFVYTHDSVNGSNYNRGVVQYLWISTMASGFPNVNAPGDINLTGVVSTKDTNGSMVYGVHSFRTDMYSYGMSDTVLASKLRGVRKESLEADVFYLGTDFNNGSYTYEFKAGVNYEYIFLG